MKFSVLLFLATTTFFLRQTVVGQWPQKGGPRGNYQIAALEGEIKQVMPWSIPLGVSDSETVIDGEVIYLTEEDITETGEDAHRVSARSMRDGSKIWERLLSERSYGSQDISDAYPVRPLATPTLIKNRLVVAGFGGSIRCLNKDLGEVIWSKDLVEEYAALPIQYGAATSPWSDGERVLIGCGGEQGLVLCLSLNDGSELWRAAAGAASYASFVPFQCLDGSQQIVYAAGDELLALNVIDGSIQWRYRYPRSGLTNAVTPIAVAPGKLLIGGQGVEGTRLLSISSDAGESPTKVEVVWKITKAPFYCNWVQMVSHPDRVVGFAGNTLNVLDWNSGKLVSQLRGWTDCNVIAMEDSVLAIRGDGFIGRFRLVDDQLAMESGSWKIKDRVWMAPSMIGKTLLVRGRNGLHAISLEILEPMEEALEGSAVTSMDAMYGNPPEAISKLLTKIKERPQDFAWEDFEIVANDRSIRISDGIYAKVVDSLVETMNLELAFRVANAWEQAESNSIFAFEKRMELLRAQGRSSVAEKEEANRMVEVAFAIQAPADFNSSDQLFVVGNSKNLGSWKGEGLPLIHGIDGKWGGKVRIPKGDLQFKVCGGGMDRAETREDGGRISNRRLRIREGRTLEIDVESIPAKK